MNHDDTWPVILYVSTDQEIYLCHHLTCHPERPLGPLIEENAEVSDRWNKNRVSVFLYKPSDWRTKEGRNSLCNTIDNARCIPSNHGLGEYGADKYKEALNAIWFDTVRVSGTAETEGLPFSNPRLIVVVHALGAVPTAAAAKAFELPAPSAFGAWTSEAQAAQQSSNAIHNQFQPKGRFLQDLPHPFRHNAYANLNANLTFVVNQTNGEGELRDFLRREDLDELGNFGHEVSKIASNGPWYPHKDNLLDDLVDQLRVLGSKFGVTFRLRPQIHWRHTGVAKAQPDILAFVGEILTTVGEIKLAHSPGDEIMQQNASARLAGFQDETYDNGRLLRMLLLTLRGDKLTVGSFLREAETGQHQSQIYTTFNLTPPECTASPTPLHSLRVAAVFVVFFQAMQELANDWKHQSSVPSCPTNVLCQTILDKISDINPNHRISSIESLSTLLYLVKMGDGSVPGFIVKFVKGEYGAQAHKTLYAAGLAPTLHSCLDENQGVKTGWSVIIMDEVRGQRANDPDFKAQPLHFKQLALVMTVLQHHNLVHGDLRPENIIVNDSGLFICDWDWAGVQSKATRYPDLNPAVKRSPLAKTRGRIAFSHDMYHLAVIDELWRETGRLPVHYSTVAYPAGHGKPYDLCNMTVPNRDEDECSFNSTGHERLYAD